MRRKTRVKAGHHQESSPEAESVAPVDAPEIDAASADAPEVDVEEAAVEADSDIEVELEVEAEPEAEPEPAAEADEAMEDDAPDEPVRDAGSDHEEAFWGGGALGGKDNDDAFAVVIAIDADDAIESETLDYMGTVPRTRVDPAELDALAEWAESKTCRLCRRKIKEHHDPALLKHDECRDALRVSRLLRRYNT